MEKIITDANIAEIMAQLVYPSLSTSLPLGVVPARKLHPSSKKPL